jgi:hypothetical protein
MDKSKLEALIEALGKDFFAIISGEKHLPYSTKAGGQKNS